jgi:hypothetical protein
MSYVAIRTLGPLAVWEVGDDGSQTPLALKSGAGAAGILVALAFLENKFEKWLDVAAYMWDEVELQDKPLEVRKRISTQASRLRPQLGNRNAVALGKPAFVERGTAVRIDWDDFQAHQKDEKYERALSLIAGYPLAGVGGNSVDITRLRQEVAVMVKNAVCASLEGLERAVPESPDLLDLAARNFEEFAPECPAEWIPPGLAPAMPRKRRVRVTGTRPATYGEFEREKLFERSPKGEGALVREQQEATEEGGYTWWSEGAWLGKFFAFWFRIFSLPCEEVAITYTGEVYNAARFEVDESKGPVDKPKDKATIIEAPTLLLGDETDKQISCARTNWGFAYNWARSEGDKLLKHSSRPSIFGVVGRPVYPGIAGVHVLFQTSDGYILFGLRAPKIAFHERTWSASFEEQIAVEARDFTGDEVLGDQTLLDAVHGGLFEEWGIEESAVAATSCLAVGREWGRTRFEGKPFLNLSATTIAACRLNIPLTAVWAGLKEVAGVPDRDEHRAWAGISFGSRADVLRFVAAAKGRHDQPNLLAELCDRPDIDADLKGYPHGGSSVGIHDRGLMPTSAARLVLASAWFETLKTVDNSH